MKDTSANRRKITDAAKARAFCLSGDARITLESVKTEARYTFRISVPKDADKDAPSIWFTSLLTGSDNEGDFTYFGNIKNRPAGPFFEVGRKSRLQADSAPVRAFAWFWSNLMKGAISANLNLWHEGRCCRCGRALTVPSSIESGIGPECIKHVSAVEPAATDAERVFPDYNVKPAKKPALTPAQADQAASLDKIIDLDGYNEAANAQAPARKLAGRATATGWSAKPARKAKVNVMHNRPFDDSLDGVFGD